MSDQLEFPFMKDMPLQYKPGPTLFELQHAMMKMIRKAIHASPFTD